jgi:tetratricopeptide (TPR) repeat protein
MGSKADLSVLHRGRWALTLLGLLVFLSYGNSFDAGWHLDDFPNILENRKVHSTSADLASLADVVASIFKEGLLDRPVAMATLAASWHFGKDDPAGYHAVNIAIHLLSAVFLYLTLRALFATPRLCSEYDRRRSHFISLLAAALWALNPVQVQAVTYIVQRMASLSAMLYILAIYIYVQARLSETHKTKALLIGAVALVFVAAVLTKENAATLPLAILLVEAAFFRQLSRAIFKRALLATALAAGAVLATALVLLDGNIGHILNYGQRDFSLSERLLTEPRVLLWYLSLLFYPVPDRLSIVHDIDVSTSLLHPWTTLPAIAILLGASALSVFRLRKWTIVCFSLLFFFLNHLVESSVIPLELVFEHRNYLPSMFVFWPAAVGLERLLSIYRTKSRPVYFAVWGFIPLLLAALGTGTFIRNIDWASPQLLWEGAIEKAPRSSRPYHNLAWAYYERIGDPDTAMTLYQKALGGRKDNVFAESAIWNNMASICHSRREFDRAADYWEKAYRSYPKYYEFRYRQVLALMRGFRWPEALAHLDSLLSQYPTYAKALNMKGLVLMLEDRPGDALAALRRCVKLAPHNWRALLNLGACYHLLGDFRKAEVFLREASRESAQDRACLLWLARNRLALDDPSGAHRYIDQFLGAAPLPQLNAYLQACFADRSYRDEVIFPEKDDKLIEGILQRVMHRSKPL